MDADARRTSGWTSQWTRTSRAADASGRGRGSDADASGRGRGSDADAPNHERTRTRLGRGRASAADVPRTRTCLGRGRASDADAPRTRACHGRERSADRRRADTGAERARAQRAAWGHGAACCGAACVWCASMCASECYVRCCVLLLVVRRPWRSSATTPTSLRSFPYEKLITSLAGGVVWFFFESSIWHSSQAAMKVMQKYHRTLCWCFRALAPSCLVPRAQPAPLGPSLALPRLHPLPNHPHMRGMRPARSREQSPAQY